ncbi:MAG: aconitate hydratase AcnA [Deltaproteobacteria bacterium]|nr:aconitate hydratase AcnA [Deltaproteobacteria bacterium]
MQDPLGAQDALVVGDRRLAYCSLPRLEKAGLGRLHRLPVSLRIVLESLVRNLDGIRVREEDVRALAAWHPNGERTAEIPFVVSRVLLQDFTGVPLIADLAAMRSALARLGKHPGAVEPRVPVDLVVDHSVQVDAWGSAEAVERNLELELHRNGQRYAFLRWGAQAFRSLRIVPPGAGICHQVNLEHLAQVVRREGEWALPDTLLGTDSHTTMVNGLGVVGWGVGGIEAEAAMLGQPAAFLTPDVVGVHLSGALREGVTATDLVLTLTERLRAAQVVGTFVEFFGAGARALPAATRATVANMAPEYGATMGFFPTDERTLDYLRATGRGEDQIRLVRTYLSAQGLFGIPEAGHVDYSRVVEVDLSAVEPSLAGPSRPQDRVGLAGLPARVREALPPRAASPGRPRHGDVVIAAITSCTNTSNPQVMLAAGLLARKAVARGLRVPPWVKTSLAPGSRQVTGYLESTGLQRDLDALGFQAVGYGCTTCIGNAGPLPPQVAARIGAEGLWVASVLSGNRNFEARIHPAVRGNFLMSPPLVVAFALAGTVDLDLTREPIGTGGDGRPVFLRDLWPSDAEIQALAGASVPPARFAAGFAAALAGSKGWQAIPAPTGAVYRWDEASTYVREPPFLAGFTAGAPPAPSLAFRGARALALLGDSVTTDHISPAGSIDPGSPAGRWLQAQGVAPADFNSYGARRGNHEVMVRGTFANGRLRNRMVPGAEGGVTVHQPTGERMSIFDAAARYQAEGVPLLVLAGMEYGTGSSRDWAAKGTRLLGVRAVAARSFERIHRANLVGMGVLPLELPAGASAESLGLDGTERFDLAGLDGLPRPRQGAVLRVHRGSQTLEVPVAVRVDFPAEVEYLRHGGILPFVLGRMIAGA